MIGSYKKFLSVFLMAMILLATTGGEARANMGRYLPDQFFVVFNGCFFGGLIIGGVGSLANRGQPHLPSITTGCIVGGAIGVAALLSEAARAAPSEAELTDFVSDTTDTNLEPSASISLDE